LSSNTIINHILAEEKSQSSQSTSQTTFVTHFGKEKRKTQNKEKEADTKSKSGKCMYYKKKGYYKAEFLLYLQ